MDIGSLIFINEQAAACSFIKQIFYLQHIAVFLQQYSGSINRINTGTVLDRRELFLTIDLEDQAVIHLVYQIKSQRLELEGIWLIWNDWIAGFVDAWNLLLHYMQRHSLIQSFLEPLNRKQIVSDCSEAISQISVRKPLGEHLICHFVIFYNVWLAVLLAHNTDPFLREGFLDYLRATHLATCDRCT